MAETTLTVKQIIDLGLWDKVCEYKGWDRYILAEGRIDYDTVVTFDSEFKHEEIENVNEWENWSHEDLVHIVEEFEKALKYYADESNWEKRLLRKSTFPQYEPDAYEKASVMNDKGELARKALGIQ